MTSVSVVSSKLARFLLPPGIDTSVMPLLVGRGLRGLCDGFVAVLLPAYLLGLGFGQFAVGLISSATLIGSALATILVGVIGSRYPLRRLLILAAVLMAITGVGFAGLSSLWPLLIVAFIGTLNPSSGDVSVFLPLEQARLAEAAHRKRVRRCLPDTALLAPSLLPSAPWPRPCRPGSLCMPVGR